MLTQLQINSAKPDANPTDSPMGKRLRGGMGRDRCRQGDRVDPGLEDGDAPAARRVAFPAGAGRDRGTDGDTGTTFHGVCVPYALRWLFRAELELQLLKRRFE